MSKIEHLTFQNYSNLYPQCIFGDIVLEKMPDKKKRGARDATSVWKNSKISSNLVGGGFSYFFMGNSVFCVYSFFCVYADPATDLLELLTCYPLTQPLLTNLFVCNH